MKRRALYTSLAFALFFASPAYAYIDPGTGSILLQALIGGIAAATTFVTLKYHALKSAWARVVATFKKK